MKNNERLQALDLLLAVLQQKKRMSPTAISPLAKEICYGVCRHFYRLEAIADILLSKRPKTKDLWLLILMGLYQLHYMHQPDYAVVKETVDLLSSIKKTWAKALVNAVLRRFCRESKLILDQVAKNIAFLYGHPPWLLKQLQADWPNDWVSIVNANDVHPPMTLRVNSKKIQRSDYLERLMEADLQASLHPIAPEALTLKKPCDVHLLPGFAQGFVSVQDAAAQLAAERLFLKPKLRVLDACCAPGGKTCHLLEKEPGIAACLALDVDAKRLEKVQENLDRLGLHAELIKNDALRPNTWWDGQFFDRILLDAPCSSTGVIRRHADIKLLLNQQEVSALIKVQEKLLDALWPLLAPGGLMLYATCSVFKEENENQIMRFLKRHTDVQVLKETVNYGHSTDYGLQILPGTQGMDGFFYSILQKVEG